MSEQQERAPRPVLSRLSTANTTATTATTTTTTTETVQSASSDPTRTPSPPPLLSSADHPLPHPDLIHTAPQQSSEEVSSVRESALVQGLERIKALQIGLAVQHASLEQLTLSATSPLKPINTAGIAGATIGSAGGARGKVTEYDDLAQEFKTRQVGVEEIMQQLSTLAQELKTFHALPSPVLFPSTTTSTATANPSPGQKHG